MRKMAITGALLVAMHSGIFPPFSLMIYIDIWLKGIHQKIVQICDLHMFHFVIFVINES